jgi:hypothetical protein
MWTLGILGHGVYRTSARATIPDCGALQDWEHRVDLSALAALDLGGEVRERRAVGSEQGA